MVATLVAMMIAAPCANALSVSGFSLKPSTTVAGGHPTVVVSASLQGGNVPNLSRVEEARSNVARANNGQPVICVSCRRANS